MQHSLIAQGDALVASLAGLEAKLKTAMLPYSTRPFTLDIAARGQPDCLPAVLLVRPASGPAEVLGAKCVYTAQWVISAYWSLSCPLDEAQAYIYTLMSGKGESGSVAEHLSIPANLAPLRAIGLNIKSEKDIGPAVGFRVMQYAVDGPPNTFWAQLPVTLTYTG